MTLPEDGITHVKFTPDARDWASDGKTHAFGAIPMGPASCRFIKHADRTFEVRISGLFGDEIRLYEAIPEAVLDIIHVFVEWNLEAGTARLRLLPPRAPWDPGSIDEKPPPPMLEGQQLIDTVASDLRYLGDEWHDSIDDHALRRASTVLRRLLVENELQRAWKAAGFKREPTIRSSTLSKVLQLIPLERILFASAGGAYHGGMAAREAVMFLPEPGREPEKQIEEVQRTLGDRLPDELTGLRAFVEAPCVVCMGALVARRILIKYVANKLGGAHYDERRRDTKEERLFQLLDEAAKNVQVAEKNAIYFELLSIGQALVRAEDVRRFLRATE